MQNTFLLRSALRGQQSYSISYKLSIPRLQNLNALCTGKLLTFNPEKALKLFAVIIFFFHVNGSLENIQVDLFEKEICGGLKLSIFQYSIIQFQSSTLGGMFSLVYLSIYDI